MNTRESIIQELEEIRSEISNFIISLNTSEDMKNKEGLEKTLRIIESYIIKIRNHHGDTKNQ